MRYRGSQLVYGVHYLRTHRTTRLVTLMIGDNDAFRCVATTSDQCVSEFSGLLTQLTTHVTTILQALRGGARYTGQLVLVTYYASNYHGIAATESSLLDSALTSPARRFRALIANGYGAFGRVAMRSGGDTCRAGLLTTLTTGGCGVHPSAAGQRLLAETVERAIRPQLTIDPRRPQVDVEHSDGHRCSAHHEHPGAAMKSTIRRTTTIAAVGLAVLATLVAASPADAGPAHHSARHHHQAQPVRAGSDYLALGDSVSFGYREPTNTPTPNYANAKSFVGFPEDIAAELHLHVANASCPGETSASLNNSHAQSYACETDDTGKGPGYRTAYPLHVRYAGSQLAYGVHYLRNHRQTRLVTLMIGANDAFLCEATTSDGCASELPTVLAHITKNVATTLRAIRRVYQGQIVIVNYYSTDYTSATQRASSQALNKALDKGARPFHVRLAGGYTTFKNAARQAGGNTCTAGLLTTLSGGGCGVHPSVAGQELLAGTVEREIRS